MIPNDFHFIAEILQNKSGFALSSDQIYLLESRLGPILRQNNLISLEDLVNALKLDDKNLKNAISEVISVNDTRFFRNRYAFYEIKDFLSVNVFNNPQKKTLRILSVGCASGQEAVSIALLLSEANHPEIQTQIYALDMSHSQIERAKKGRYTNYEIQKGLPIRLLLKYFEPHKELWQLKSDILQSIHYYSHNILNPLNGKDFDIILCQNMISLMTLESQKKVLENLSKIIKSDGILILGMSEKLTGKSVFEPIPEKMGIYRLGTTARPSKKTVTSYS